ncbi:MAG: hypothetical protein ABI629_16355 [bacterium]
MARALIMPLELAAGYVREQRVHGRRVVVAHGVFAAVEPRHVRYIGAAERLGHRLVVIVGRWAGGKVPARSRAEVVAAIRGVDAVVPVELDIGWPMTADALAVLKPDVFAVMTGGAGREAWDVCERDGIELVAGVGAEAAA